MICYQIWVLQTLLQERRFASIAQPIKRIRKQLEYTKFNRGDRDGRSCKLTGSLRVLVSPWLPASCRQQQLRLALGRLESSFNFFIGNP